MLLLWNGQKILATNEFYKNLDFMFSLELANLDGHTLEPFYTDLSKF